MNNQAKPIRSAFIREVKTQHCTEHGDFESSHAVIGASDFWTKCPGCVDAATKAADAQRAEEQRRTFIRSRIDAAEIPAHFSRARLDDNAPGAVLDWIDGSIANTGRGPLILVGPVGTGKTHTAVACLRRVIEHGVPGRFVTTSAYGRAIRNTWNKRGDTTEAQVLKHYAHGGFLVLDELGASRDVDVPLIQELICERYDIDAMRSTIVISNLAPAKFSDAVGERAADRIREGSTLVTMTGKSRRAPSTK